MQIQFYSQKFTGKNKQAFSLVEVLLYLAITSVIVITLSSFFATLIQTQNRNQTIMEVDQNGLQILEIITRTIRNSTSVTSPTSGTSGNALTLVMPTPANSPTIFDLVGGSIRIKEGAASAINLSSSRVTASGLTFSNLTGSASKSTIKFQFTLSYINPGNAQEFDYSRTFYGSATLR